MLISQMELDCTSFQHLISLSNVSAALDHICFEKQYYDNTGICAKKPVNCSYLYKYFFILIFSVVLKYIIQF